MPILFQPIDCIGRYYPPDDIKDSDKGKLGKCSICNHWHEIIKATGKPVKHQRMATSSVGGNPTIAVRRS